MIRDSNRTGSILLKSGMISRDQLDRALNEQESIQPRCPLGELLVKLGFITDEAVAKVLAEQLNISFFEFTDEFQLTTEEIKLIPEPIARKFCIIPVRKENGSLIIAMKDPLDLEAVSTVRMLVKLEIHKVISTQDKIIAAINKVYKEEAHIERNFQDIIDLETERENGDKKDVVDTEQLKVLANDAPVVRLVNLMLLQSIRDRASDLHLEPSEHEVSVRLRIDGILKNIMPVSKAIYPAIVTRIKILAGMDITERRLPQDGRFKFKAQSLTIDVRVSSLPVAGGEKMVLRILNRAALILDMKDIGFEDDMLANFRRILKQPHGIILLTGPTGSGKTTALYSALNFLKSPERNIQTVEDPIEYLIQGINQMQIKPKIDLTFANALRSILRQDPDIIMIGEIRDLDTAQIAMRASLTGHLVLSTLHTNDATSAFSRLYDIGVERYLIAATTNLVISQRLVRCICEFCKEEVKLPVNKIKLITTIFSDASKWKCYMGKGCKKCFNTGYKGRTGIFEFLEVTSPIKELIVEGVSDSALRQKCVELGMVTLLASGLSKVKQGITTIEEVLSVCPSPEL
ncbi:MAG: ATPase, T2SS/T4P/T4SS family [Candidatus Omnitrophota bacterium]